MQNKYYVCYVLFAIIWLISLKVTIPTVLPTSLPSSLRNINVGVVQILYSSTYAIFSNAFISSTGTSTFSSNLPTALQGIQVGV